MGKEWHRLLGIHLNYSWIHIDFQKYQQECVQFHRKLPVTSHLHTKQNTFIKQMFLWNLEIWLIGVHCKLFWLLIDVSQLFDILILFNLAFYICQSHTVMYNASTQRACKMRNHTCEISWVSRIKKQNKNKWSQQDKHAGSAKTARQLEVKKPNISSSHQQVYLKL